MKKNWFNTTVRYYRVNEQGLAKTVTEHYLVCASTPTEAETIVTNEIAPFSMGNFSVKNIKEEKFAEIIYGNNQNDTSSLYFIVKIDIITLDEKTGKEKRATTRSLVVASDMAGAISSFTDAMKTTVVDYEVTSYSKTKFLDILSSND